MVESLANGHVDGFCVGAPWNSVAVDLASAHPALRLGDRGAGGGEGAGRAPRWADEHPDVLPRLVRAHRASRAVHCRSGPTATRSRDLSSPHRLAWASAAEVIRRTLEGRLKMAPDGDRAGKRALPAHRTARREPPRSGAGCVDLRADGAVAAGADVARAACGNPGVFRPDLYDAALGADGASLPASRRMASVPSRARPSTRTTSPNISRIGPPNVEPSRYNAPLLHCTKFLQNADALGRLSGPARAAAKSWIPYNPLKYTAIIIPIRGWHEA